MSALPFGKYQLLRKLATGGMAEVWLAQQTGIEDFRRNVVIKRILPHLAEDAEFVQMFLNEAKIAARFAHANIAQIYDLGRENGSYFIAMEYVHGEDLGRIMRKAWSAGQWLTKPLAIRIIANACEGLHYAHTRLDETTGKPLRVVHRDVSPQNILVSFEGTVKLVDFGIAKAADQASLTRSGAIKGKFAYMSPEQASGKILDHRSDIFALGLVLYELLTGVRPIKRENDLATLQAALECAIEPPSAVSDVPSELDSVVMSALAKAPDERYRDARQFQVALEEILGAQRWVATSVQISELMSTLFADRLSEEAKAEAQEKAKRPEEVDPSMQTILPTEPSAPADPGWEAPPGPAPKKKTPPTGAEKTSISRPDVPAVATGSVEEWEAPPGQIHVPGHRRRVAGDRHAGMRTLGPRSPTGEVVESTSLSAPEVPAVKVTRERKSTRPAPEARDPDNTSPRPPTPRPQAAPVTRSGEQPVKDDSKGARRRNTPGNGISRRPAAMARMDAKALEKLARPEPEPEAVARPLPDVHESVDVLINVEAMRARSRQRFQVLLYVSVAIALLLLGFLFWRPIFEALNSRSADSQGVFLTVTSNEPVDVFVVHPEAGPGSARTSLGKTPLHEKPGAHLEDVVILENPSRGIQYEEPIRYGTPGEVRMINKEFLSGWFKPIIKPVNTTGLTFYLGNQEIGKYLPGGTINMVEGVYDLELRGPKLKESVPVHVTVNGNKTTATELIDLTKKLY